jgi:hypothetical protein
MPTIRTIPELDETMAGERRSFVVVHPLDVAPEKKVDTANLGPMRMTRTVRVCLYALRGYLLLMFGLLAFRVLQLAGALHG